jgi:hypothetical protein
LARQPKARQSLERKIRLIEKWVVDGAIPPNAPVLRGEKDVRRWEDPEHEITSWVSFSVLAPNGPNADLRRRLDEVLPDYRRIREGARQPRKAQRGRSITERQVQRERDRLAIQNEELLAEIRSLKQALAISHEDLALLKLDNSDLTAKLRAIAPMTVVPKR